MNFQFLDNTHTRVWLEDRDLRLYCGKTAMYQVTFENDTIMLMLCEQLTTDPYKDSEILQHFCNGANILITHVYVGRPDLFENNDVFLTFYNCRLHRSWIPNMTVLQPGESNRINFFVALEAHDYKWMK